MIYESPQCYLCKHFIDSPDGPKCKAFEHIPIAIWSHEHDHRTPYPGDHGIQFEPIAEPPKDAPAP